MFRNYLTVAVRNLLRQKLPAFINIFGLALGIACCLLMALYVKHEWSHDRFHERGDRIFRVITREVRPNGIVDHRALLPHPIADALKAEMPAVVQAAAFIRTRTKVVFGERAFQERVGLVSADFLEMFSFPLLAGDPATALARPDGIAIGEGMARKFFGDLDADYGNVMGQPLTLPDCDLAFVVTGVLAPVPDVSSLRFEALIPVDHVGGRSRLVRALVVLQYTASIALMICTGVMVQQQAFMQSRDLGYDQEQVVVVRASDEAVAGRYKQEILKDPRIAGVTISDRAFTTGSAGTGCQLPDGKTIFVRLLCVDPDYLPTLRIPVLEGRNFSEAHPSDRDQAVLVNETLVRTFGLKDPVGKPLPGYRHHGMDHPTIIGVVRDFHIDSLHRRIQPLILQMRYYSNRPNLLIRIRPGDMRETVAMLEETWAAVAPPDERIRLSFLDENLDRQYREEARWQRVLTYASAFAIAISCLGLLGLASLAVARRTKEIGIRKVLGASVGSLMGLLSKDFVKLLIAANLIAWPVAYWAMDRWLESFAYRLELGVGIFAFAGMLTLAVALLTVSCQTIRAALANPVDALKYE